MRLRGLWVCGIAISFALAGCHHKAPPPAAPAPAAPTTPPPAPPPPARPTEAAPVDEYSRVRALDLDGINRLGLLDDAHFDYDRSDVRDSDRTVLAKDGEVLRKFDFLMVSVEGHCDERGTAEYNLALGDRRAKAAYDYLVSLGVPASRLKTVSYGKESPLCKERVEDCWSRNRRAHIIVTGKQSVR